VKKIRRKTLNQDKVLMG